MNFSICEVVLVEANLLLKYFLVDLMQLGEDLNQVETCTLPQPVQVLLLAELSLLALNFAETFPAYVIRLVADFGHFGVETRQFFLSLSDLLSDVALVGS